MGSVHSEEVKEEEEEEEEHKFIYGEYIHSLGDHIKTKYSRWHGGH